MKIKCLTLLSFLGLLLVGCVALGVPYNYVSVYEPEILPELDNAMGSNSISGSAFLRQGGGGIVNCAGNTVMLRKQVSLEVERNAYAKEFLALSSKDRAVTNTDPALLQFQRDIQGIRDSLNKQSTCDVDGKFNFSNVTPGTYTVKTKVYWVVGDQGQGGIVGSSVVIPENSVDQTYSTVISTVVSSCSVYDYYCNP